MSEWDQFPQVSGGTAVDEWEQFPEVDSMPAEMPTGEKTAATKSFYGLPETAPVYEPVPERVGPDPNDPHVQSFPDFMFKPKFEVPRLEHTPDEGTIAKYLKSIGNVGGEFISGASAPMMLAAPIPSIAGALPEMVPAQIERVQEAQKTPAGSPESIEAGFSTVAQLLGLAAGARAGLRPKPGAAKVAEPVRTTPQVVHDAPRPAEDIPVTVQEQASDVARNDAATAPHTPVRSVDIPNVVAEAIPVEPRPQSPEYPQPEIKGEAPVAQAESAKPKFTKIGIADETGKVLVEGKLGEKSHKNLMRDNADNQAVLDSFIADEGNVTGPQRNVFQDETGKWWTRAELQEAGLPIHSQDLVKLQAAKPPAPPERTAPSGATAEDWELKPGFKEQYPSVALKIGEKVISGKPPQTLNHADLAERHGFPKDAIPGFLDRNGEFVYQYAEDAAAVSKSNKKSFTESDLQSEAGLEANKNQIPIKDAGLAPLEPTSTKNKVTAREREQLGLPEAEQAARRDFGTVWDEAEAVVKADPTAPQRLVTELTENPRSLSDKENALLLRRQIEAQNEHTAAVDALNSAPGDPAAIQRLETARNEVQAVYDAGKAAGTETGRGLNARRMLANNDFTLAKMEAEYRAVANEGRPLSSKQATEVKTLNQKIQQMEAKLSAYEARDAVNAGLKKARAERKPFSVVQFLSEQEVKARERISGRQSKLYSDPLGVTNVAHLADEAIIGAAHIARGVKNLGEWSKVMIQEFGEGIKPYLKALFTRAQSMHSDAAKLSTAKARTVTQTVKTLRKIGAKEFEPSKPIPVKPDKELMGLRGNLQRAKDEYYKRLVAEKQANQPLYRKGLRGAVKTINSSRAVKTSFDVSAVGRQGGWIVAGHPIMGAKAVKPMFEAMRSPEGQYRIEAEIKAHSDYASAKQAKLELTEISDTATMTKAEEAYMNSWADKIPGVAGSQRAYVTFLNKLRIEAFSSITKDLGKSGKAATNEARIIANYVNVATGRGYVGKWAGAFAGLNHVFFAPRYVLSRFQLLLGQPLFHQLGKGSPRVRALIAKEYARSLAGTATVVGLGITAGAAFNTTEKRSADFLKLKFGNSRLDPLYGLQQTTLFLNRMGYNILRVAKHEKIPYKERDIGQRFVRSKLSPAYGSLVNLGSGTDFLGQPTSLEKEAINLFDPIAREDIIKALQEQGYEKGAALSALALLGMGLQTYPEKPVKSERRVTLDEAMKDRNRKKLQGYLQTTK